jgi:hypothetical protein
MVPAPAALTQINRMAARTSLDTIIPKPDGLTMLAAKYEEFAENCMLLDSVVFRF